ncbi:CYTH domain-containing protein [Micromonospora sp. A202]|uniref:CYTH domain-containing protein n=1 Tax=Micromonospora sp. A202 TaxID=2572899 RepID=UPI0011514374|nr:adenylate cyclase [Micromonospora sp. A202]TQJ23683.1 CYTH domain-containing protein [Micromonospora sp. A202]
MALEIERKFLVDHIPAAVDGARLELEQGYLAADANGIEVRLRRSGSEFLLGVKYKVAAMSRVEVELPIGEEEFGELWPATVGARLCKTRRTLTCDDQVFYIDDYHNDLAGLVTAEIEFGSESEAEEFRPPSWLGPEITGVEAYKNRTLAQAGLPVGVTT